MCIRDRLYAYNIRPKRKNDVTYNPVKKTVTFLKIVFLNSHNEHICNEGVYLVAVFYEKITLLCLFKSKF